MLAREDADTDDLFGGRPRGRGRSPVPSLGARETTAQARRLAGLPAGDLADLVQELTSQMHAAAADLQFELAARLRDEIADLKKELRQMVEANR
jgi:excinuclease ABC subunit B